MLKKIILLLFFTGTGTVLTAQKSREGSLPVARASEKGIWIYLGNVIPKGFSYTIERKLQNTNRYETIGKTSMAKSLAEMESLNQQWASSFEKLDQLTKKEIQATWNYLQKNKTTDSLRSDNLPVMHLLAGTSFLDTKVQNNQTYIYRVSNYDENGNLKGTQETPPASWPITPKMPDIRFSHSRYADGKMILEWRLKELKDLAHFNIYRSVSGKNEFSKIKADKGFYNQDDSLVLLAIDTIGRQPAWYDYEIEPVDIYGNAGTTAGFCSGGNLADYYAPPVSKLRAEGLKENHAIKLSWKYENKKYLNGISIMRSNNYDSGYQRIATVEATDTSYTDIVPIAGENYYYYLLLHSAENEAIPTAKVFAYYYSQSAKPEPPRGIAAETIQKGVRIHWEYDNPYITGFYVFRNAGSNENFVQVSGLLPAEGGLYSYTDTSKNLQPGEVYLYAVRSINDMNQLSDLSDTVSAYPGTPKKLSSPEGLRFRTDNNVITLIWDDLRPVESDLLGYSVYKKAAAEKDFRLLQQGVLSSEKNFFIDSAVSAGIQYEYAVSARDYFGNESPLSKPVKIMTSEDLPPVPSGISILTSANTALVRWGQLSGEDLKIKIYRTEQGQNQPILLGTVNSEDEEFADSTVKSGKLYFYQLSTLNNKNKESSLSEKFSIRIQ